MTVGHWQNKWKVGNLTGYIIHNTRFFCCTIDMHFNIPDDVQPNHSRLQVHKPRDSRSDESSAIDQISLQGGHLVACSEGDKILI